MAVTASTSIESRWDAARTGADELDALVYRSNLLASDRSVVNFGGGNTSVKMSQPDHTGRATRGAVGQGLRKRPGHDRSDRVHRSQARRDPAARRAAGDVRRGDGRLSRALPARPVDAAPVDRDAPPRLHPASPRRPHAPGCDRRDRRRDRRRASRGGVLRHRRSLDPLHPAGIRALEARRRGSLLEPERRDRPARQARARHVGRDRCRVLRGDPRRDQPGGCFRRGAPVGRRAVRRGGAGAARARSACGAARRGHAGPSRRPLGRRSARASDRSLAGGAASSSPAAIRASSPRSALRAPTISFTPSGAPPGSSSIRSSDDAAGLRDRLVEQVGLFHEREHAYFERYRAAGDTLLDPSPRVVLIEGVGLVSAGRTLKAAKLARDLYLRAIAVMRGASGLGGFVSLDDEESYAIEYWPLELYKLSLAPAPREFQGAVVLITGGAGGIGSAAARAFAAEGACVVLADLDGEGAGEVARRARRGRGCRRGGRHRRVVDRQGIPRGGARLRRSRRGGLERRYRLERADPRDVARALGPQQRHPCPRLLPRRAGRRPGCSSSRAPAAASSSSGRRTPLLRGKAPPRIRLPRLPSSTSHAAWPRSSAVTESA